MCDILAGAIQEDTSVRNNIFEKKLSKIAMDNIELRRVLELCDRSYHHILKLREQTIEKYTASCAELSSNSEKIEKKLDSACSELSLGFEAITKIEKNIPKFENIEGITRLDDVKIKDILNKCNSLLEKLKHEKDAASGKYEELLEKRECSMKEREAAIKRNVNCDKEIAELEEEVEKKTKEIELVKDMKEKEQKLLLEQLQMEETENEKLCSENRETIQNLEEQLKTVMIDIENEKKSLESFNLELEKEMSMKMEKINSADYTSDLREFVFAGDIKQMVEKIEEDRAELRKIEEDLGEYVLNCQFSPLESLEILSAELSKVEEKRKKMEMENLKLKQLHGQYLMKKETICSKNLESSRLQQTLHEESLKIEHLLRINNQKNVKLGPTDVVRVKQPPVQVSHQIHAEVNNSVDFYPGIIPIKRKKTGENVVSFDKSSFDSNNSMLSFDSGITQEGTIMGGLFSPLKQDNIEEEKNASELHEFSMMDHIREFTQRGTNKARSTFENTFTNETISRRFSGNEFLCSKDNSFEKKSTDVSAEVSSMSEDGYDELLANDSNLEMDQSDWGSDF